MNLYYLNKDKTYRPATLQEWAEQFVDMSIKSERHVDCDQVAGKHVSTVWLGIDHNPCCIEGSEPLLFETMVFGEYEDGCEIYMERYSTWEEAVEGHQNAVEWVKKHYE